MPHRTAAILTGQSTVGKTKVVQILEQTLPLEIINCDRFVMYKRLDAGRDTKKILEAAQTRTHNPYHLYGTLNLDEPTPSPQEFLRKSDAIVRKALQQNRIPLVEGFSGGYLRALLNSNNEEDRNFQYSPVICLGYPKDTKLVKLLTLRAERFISEGGVKESKYLQKHHPNSFPLRQSSIYQFLIQYQSSKLNLEEAKMRMVDDMILVLSVQSFFFEEYPECIWVESDYKQPELTAKKVLELLTDKKVIASPRLNNKTT